MTKWFDWVDLYGAAFENRTLPSQLKDWLYEDNYDEQKLKEFNLLHTIPVVSDYMDYLLDSRSAEEYLERYGMDYSDIHDPRKLPNSSSSTRLIGSTYRMISRNVEKLYR